MRTNFVVFLLLLIVNFSTLLEQPTDPSDLPPDLQKYFLVISSNLNETLYPENGTLSQTDPELYQMLTKLYQSSFPAIDILTNASIANNTWLNFSVIQQLNQIGLELFNALSARIMIPSKIPLDTELNAMKDIINYIDLPGKSIDIPLGQEVQTIINGIAEKLTNRRIPKYEVVGINSTVADAQSRSNYILIFAGLRDLSERAFQGTMTHEVGHGELSHIPQGTLVRIFNDFYWTPIIPQVPGLNMSRILTSSQAHAAKLLPALISSALSRSNEYAADAFAIKMGIELFDNPCGMVDAIRNFTQDQPSLPFASHPNLQDRLTAALQLVEQYKAGPCSAAADRVQYFSSFFLLSVFFTVRNR